VDDLEELIRRNREIAIEGGPLDVMEAMVIRATREAACRKQEGGSKDRSDAVVLKAARADHWLRSEACDEMLEAIGINTLRLCGEDLAEYAMEDRIQRGWPCNLDSPLTEGEPGVELE